MGTRLYVGNLPYEASEVSIREFIEQSSSRQVSQIKIISNRFTRTVAGLRSQRSCGPSVVHGLYVWTQKT